MEKNLPVRGARETSARMHVALEAVSFVAIALGLFGVLYLHLLPGLLAGLLVYQLIHALAPLLARRLSGHRARLIALIVLSTVIVGVLSAVTFVCMAHFKADTQTMPKLFDKMMDIVDQARDHLPEWADRYLPEDIEEMRAALAGWLHAHMATLQLAGREAIRGIAHVVIGMILGAIIAVDASDPSYRRPLAAHLIARVSGLADAFRRIVFAQVKISLFNTAFTALFLLVALPMFHSKLPLAKTLVIVTFIVGLLPVIGNLISNALIIIVGLSVSLPVTLAALVFLIVIHKLEYFLNARIVGIQIEARSWELLLAMLVMEAAFGLAGVIAAPIFYAYAKRELRLKHLV